MEAILIELTINKIDIMLVSVLLFIIINDNTNSVKERTTSFSSHLLMMTLYCRSWGDVALSREFMENKSRRSHSPPFPRPSALWDSGTIKYILSRRKIRSPRREGMKMADAKQKRNEQLKRWLGSETDIEPPILKKKKTKVKFDDGAVFLAACSSGDTEEVLRMIDRGADINYANVDGLTALHQVCILQL